MNAAALPADRAPEGELRMTFGEHLEELRARLLRSTVAFGAMLVVSVAFYRELAAAVTIPHFRAMAMLPRPPGHAAFLAGSYTAPVMSMMKLSMIAALFLASPVIGAQLWAFVRTGLTPRERRAAAAFAPASFLLVVLGCAFGYFVLVPYSLYGMASLLPEDRVLPLFDFGEYLELVATMTLLLGAVFQLPLGMTLLARLGLVRPSAYRRGRRNAVVANLVVAGILSPPDLVSMAAFAVPLLALYEIGILASAWAARE
jgi:sec-independent protein translocase protein TatC